MELKDPGAGAPSPPQPFWECPKCGRHFWTTYPPPNRPSRWPLRRPDEAGWTASPKSGTSLTSSRYLTRLTNLEPVVPQSWSPAAAHKSLCEEGLAAGSGG